MVNLPHSQWDVDMCTCQRHVKKTGNEACGFRAAQATREEEGERVPQRVVCT